MGSQIALQTALAGRYRVTLVDAVPGQLERARAQNRKLLDRSVEKGRLTKEQADAALARITDSDDVEEAVKGADLVIEAVIEDFDTKKSVFRALGKAARQDAILASNSSTIAISRLADLTGEPSRCCNMHFFHPVTVMQLCEVVKGPKTSDATIGAATEFVRSIDRTPVVLNKEIWGLHRQPHPVCRLGGGDAPARRRLRERRGHRHRGAEGPQLADGPVPSARLQRPRHLLWGDEGSAPPGRGRRRPGGASEARRGGQSRSQERQGILRIPQVSGGAQLSCPRSPMAEAAGLNPVQRGFDPRRGYAQQCLAPEVQGTSGAGHLESL